MPGTVSTARTRPACRGNPRCTATAPPPRGVRYRERPHGTLHGADLVLEVAVDLPLSEDNDPSTGALLVGRVDHDPWGGRVLPADGRAETDAGTLLCTARVRVADREHRLRPRRAPAGLPVPAPWTRTGALPTEFDDGTTAALEPGPREAAHALASLASVGTHGLGDRVEALAELSRPPLFRAAPAASRTGG